MPSFIAAGSWNQRTNDSNDIEPSYPGGILEDDFILLQALVHDDGGYSSIGSVSGFTKFAEATSVSGKLRVALFRRRAVGNEDETTVGVPFTADGGVEGLVGAAQLFQLRDVDWDNPIDGLSAFTEGDLDDLDMPTVQAARDNSLALACISATNNQPGGERSTADAQRLHAMAAAGLEAHLHLVLLDMKGVDGLIDVAPGPEEQYVPPPARVHRQKRVTVKHGHDRHGALIDETTVSVTGNAEDREAEIEAAIEALT